VSVTSLGLIMLQKGNADKARKYFEAALKINDRDSIALSSLATIQLSNQQF
jgi:Tfp pilus assembly protein PilF